MPASSGSTALHTDHYELTMVHAALESGAADVPSVFEVFCRHLPDGRRFGVLAGLGRLLPAIEAFRFGDAELAFLERFLDRHTLDWAARYRFAGGIVAYREGEAYFPGSPVLRVEGTFAECVVLETLVLSILNFDSAVASASARLSIAAGDRQLIEMGSRRVHEEAAVAAARAAHIAGVGTTSNLEAGRRHGVPTAGTAAHAFTLVHRDELEAFRAQIAACGVGTTLLVDTYDIEQGIRNAVAAGGPSLGAIRIDSGDLAVEVAKARARLDELGNERTRILVSGDVDEGVIRELAGCPVDAFGVGTSVVTGAGHPTAGLIYKLVERGGVPVAKRSPGKSTVAGRKWAWRLLDEDGGRAVAEELATDPTPPPGPHRELLVDVVRAGEAVHRPSLPEILAHHADVRRELPASALDLDPGDPGLPVRMRGAGP